MLGFRVSRRVEPVPQWRNKSADNHHIPIVSGGYLFTAPTLRERCQAPRKATGHIEFGVSDRGYC